METKFIKIKYADIFKCLGDIITTNRSDKKAFKNIKIVFERLQFLKKNICNRTKQIFCKRKIETLYDDTETSNAWFPMYSIKTSNLWDRNIDLTNLEPLLKIKNKIRMIHGPRKTKNVYRIKSNKNL